MPTNHEDKVAQLVKPMLKKRLFASLNKAAAPQEQMLPLMADHIEYMNRLESEGKLFASGPFIQPGVLVGLTILRTDTLEEARALMEKDPLIKQGLRTFELHVWELREGRMTIQLNASSTSYQIV
jgi:uncharacterized protein YciI